VKVTTWNVNGIRARHAEVVALAAVERPDVLCLQEIKATPEQVPERLTSLAEFWSFWHGGARGYSGVSLHLRRERFPDRPAFRHPRFDHEARIVEVEVADLVLASVYVPNGGKDYPAKLRFLGELASHAVALRQAGKKVLFCGDMNVARSAIDVHPSQRNDELIGQRSDERALFEELLAADLVDVDREFHPNDERRFTWWPMWTGARAGNVGWRIDYVLASPALAGRARQATLARQHGTSDHAPLSVDFGEGLGT
jgi:exodeoxyribonuclease III